MKQLRYLSCIALVLLSFVSTASAERMKFENDYVPLQIQQDIMRYMEHATGAESGNHALIISDLEQLLQHESKPTTGDIQKDLQRWQIFSSSAFEHIRNEIKMATRMALSAHYRAMGNVEKSHDVLPSSSYMENCYSGKIGYTMLTDYMSALATFECHFSKLSDVLSGKKFGYDERAAVVYKCMMVYACMKRAMHVQPYDCKQRAESIELSEYDPVNFMLLDAQLNSPIVGLVDISSIKGDNVESMLTSIISLSLKGITDPIYNVLNSFRYQDTNKMLYVIRFAFDTVIDASNEEISTLSKYSILQCLSELGYAPATLELGLRTETGKFNDMRPYDPKTRDVPDYQQAYRFYEKAVKEGSETAKILQGRCLFYGAGCKANKKLALQMLQPMVGHDDFPKYGAFAYASLLLDKQMGLKYEPVEVFELMCQAAQSSYEEDERQGAREIIEGTYEEYFK